MEVTVTFQEFMEQAISYEPNRRRGEAIHNLVMYMRRDLGDLLVGSPIDPILHDLRITSCLEWLEENWTVEHPIAPTMSESVPHEHQMWCVPCQNGRHDDCEKTILLSWQVKRTITAPCPCRECKKK